MRLGDGVATAERDTSTVDSAIQGHIGCPRQMIRWVSGSERHDNLILVKQKDRRESFLNGFVAFEQIFCSIFACCTYRR